MKHPAISSDAFRDLRFFKNIRRETHSKLTRELMERELDYFRRIMSSPYGWPLEWVDNICIERDARYIHNLVSIAISNAKKLTRDGTSITAEIDSDGNFSLVLSPKGKECTSVNELILSENKNVMRITIDPEDQDPAGTIAYVQKKFREERSLWNRIKAFFRK